ncbi:MAG: Endoglucanase E precursor [Firmicutes bacterium ADurb.Bin419]|nr:MAG: Endoglucanase E precursor [Firmicutes bacterium ADurb.Bin419]
MGERYLYTLPYSNIKWDFKNYVPQVVVVNLGTNDYSPSTPDNTKFITAYKDIITKVRSNYPDAHIFCAVGPMLWGSGLDTYRNNVKEVINSFASTGDSKVYFIEFPQQDGSNGYGEDWHPSKKTHELMADQLTEAIKSKFGW